MLSSFVGEKSKMIREHMLLASKQRFYPNGARRNELARYGNDVMMQ